MFSLEPGWGDGGGRFSVDAPSVGRSFRPSVCPSVRPSVRPGVLPAVGVLLRECELPGIYFLTSAPQWMPAFGHTPCFLSRPGNTNVTLIDNVIIIEHFDFARQKMFCFRFRRSKNFVLAIWQDKTN